jgi:DNA-nicking Smr family endonuclease
MKKRRIVTDEERALFEERFRETRPLVAEPNPESRAKKKVGKSGGLDGNTADRLRRGLLDPQAKLDLHGLTEAAAHRVLATFLHGAHARGIRLVLVVTGKGTRPAPDAPFDLELNTRGRGILKSVVPRWLEEPALASIVAVARSAHRRHGGAGALYIYLRKR